jgi:hypothetical protein
LGIWIEQAKIQAEGEVAHRTPGLGIGIRFQKLSEPDADRIHRFLSNLAPFARKPLLRR